MSWKTSDRSRCLDTGGVQQWLRVNSFATDQVGRVGVEIEWQVVGRHERERPALEAVRRTLGPLVDGLPGGGSVSFEPGGQLEISSQPWPTLAECVSRSAMDVHAVRSALRQAGWDLAGRGLDRGRPLVRQVADTRYRNLQRHYDQFGRAGRLMLDGSASIQVCLDAGDDSSGYRGIARRWWLAHSLGPVLAAVFANSPSRRGWRSTRLMLRLLSDPVRARLPSTVDRPRQSWPEHVLDSTLLTRRPAGTLREYLRAGHTIGEGGLIRHVKSVMAPVRAARYLELRMIDAQPGPLGWVVPAAVAAVLLDDGAASDAAAEEVRHLPAPTDPGIWIAAAARGLAHPGLATVARRCLAIAIESLGDADRGLSRAVADFAGRFTFQGRCPADRSG